MKILIVGSDLNTFLLAKYIKTQTPESDLYVTTDDNSASDVFTGIGIQENDIPAIVDFVKYNAIEFTIVLSPIAIINAIADEFKKEELSIFAPYAESARITFFNSIAKKILYKLKINTPKFGIFDRENLAIEYVRKSRFPLIISNDFTLLNHESEIYTSFSKAKLGIQKIFESNNEKIVIENNIDTPPIYVYFVTDGYNALPLISTERTEGKDYSTTIAPSKNVSDELYVKILQKVVYPLLDDITKYADNYVGIIGLKIKIVKDSFGVLEIYNGFQKYDLQAFLPLLEENINSIFFDTANGCLADNYDYIRLNNNFSYTIAINKSAVNKTDDFDENFIESEDKENFICTSSSATLNFAKSNLFEYLGTFLSKEMFNAIIENEQDKELSI